tara:strand:- start:5649 stop:5822 length:174 start_codon:yes stop_codon:yes gene_type:complete
MRPGFHNPFSQNSAISNMVFSVNINANKKIEIVKIIAIEKGLGNSRFIISINPLSIF